ncbi:unnamed protein product [Diamesa hyperborea]
MFFKLNLAFLLSSVVFASNSCVNKNTATIQAPKYYLFENGFFYIHGLSNGETVVMYKLPNEEKLPVQYTFLNSDCKYETYSYNNLKNSSFIDKKKVTKIIDDFSVVRKLTFLVQGSEKKLTFTINKSGYKVQSDIARTEIDFKTTIKSEPHKQSTQELTGPIPDYKFVSSITLTYMKDGRYFFQDSNSPAYIYGTYTFKTSDNKYHTFQYTMSSALSPNPVKDFGFAIETSEVNNEVSYYRYRSHLVTVKGTLKDLYYFIDSHGFHVINISDSKLNGLKLFVIIF